jgi:hypothetical protein
LFSGLAVALAENAVDDILYFGDIEGFFDKV